MAILLKAYFSDGNIISFTCADDEDATMKRDDLLESGHQHKGDDEHTFYPPHSITKLIISKE